jgi:hypothetical protein
MADAGYRSPSRNGEPGNLSDARGVVEGGRTSRPCCEEDPMRAVQIAMGAMLGMLLLTGCLGDDAGDVADEITHVSEVRQRTDGTRATLVGFVIADGAGTRMCAAVLESYPPQCGEPSVALEGFDLAGSANVESAEGVTWSDGELQLNGTWRDGCCTSTDALRHPRGRRRGPLRRAGADGRRPPAW